MNGDLSALNFAKSHYARLADDIERRWCDADLRELCEDLELVHRLERESSGAAKNRHAQLRVDLEAELMTLLAQSEMHKNKPRRENPIDSFDARSARVVDAIL